MRLMEKIKEIIRKKFLWNVGYVYFGSLMNGASLFLISVILGNSLTKDAFGIFLLVTLILSTVAEMSDFGLNAGLLRFAPFYISTNQSDKLKQLLKTIWTWRVYLSVILTAGGVILAYPISRYIFVQPAIYLSVAFSFLGIGGVILLGFVATYLQASQRFMHNAVLQSLKGVLRLALIGILVLLGVRNIYAFVSVYLLVPWFLFIISYRVLPEGFQQVRVEPEVKEQLNSQLARFSMWLTFASLISNIAGKIDQVMVSRYLGLANVAIYSVAYQFIQLYPLLWQSISSVLTPKLAGVTSKQDLLDLTRRTLKWIAPLIIIIGILIYPSQYLIMLFFDHKYDSSMPVYLVLSYGLLLNIVNIPFSLIINVFNKTSFAALGAFMQLFVNIFLNIILIPRYGVMGAAFAFSLGIIFSMLYSISIAIYFLIKKDFRVV